MSENRIGRIVAISVSKRKGIKKNNVNSANLLENHGIVGDVHAGNWHRQVSILALESIDKMRSQGLDNLIPGDFAENITTEFINVQAINLRTLIKIGESTILEITQIGKECHHRCAIYQAVGDCVMPREGIFARVIKSGKIYVNDKIEILEVKKNVEL